MQVMKISKILIKMNKEKSKWKGELIHEISSSIRVWQLEVSFWNRTTTPEVLLLWASPLSSTSLALVAILATIILSISWPSLKACMALMNPRAYVGTLGSTRILCFVLASWCNINLSSSALFSSSLSSRDLMFLDGSFLPVTFGLSIYSKSLMKSWTVV